MVEGLRFDPALLTGDDLEDLATFFSIPSEVCLVRLREHSTRELAQRWEALHPTTPQSVVDFYRNADPYIWELMQWHASPHRLPYWQALTHLIERYRPAEGWRRVLDFGCGVGTDSLFLAQHGYEVTLVDVDGPAFQFAQHRFRRRGLRGRFVTADAPLPAITGRYDIIVCFDVFEHLVDPLQGARRLVRALRPAGVLAQTGTFYDHEYHPCHLIENIARFSELRWHIYLAGLGLRSDGHPMLYRKGRGLEALAQRIRHWCWRCTGLWPVFVAVPERHAVSGP